MSTVRAGGRAVAALPIPLVGIALTAALAAPLVTRAPQLVLALPIAVALSLLAARSPEVLVVAGLAVVAFSGTIQAYVGLDVNKLMVPLGGVIVLGTVLRPMLRIRRQALVLPLSLILLAAFMAFTAAQVFGSPDLTVGAKGFRDGAFFILFGLVLATSLSDERARERVITAIVYLSLAVGAYATMRYFGGQTAKELAVARATSSSLQIGDHAALIGSFQVREALARWCAYAIPFCLAIGLLHRGRRALPAFAAIPLLLVAVFGTENRTALVAVAAGVAAVLVLHQFTRATSGLRLEVTLAAIGAVAVLGTVGYATTLANNGDSSSRLERILHPGSDPSYVIREQRWTEAWNLAKDHPFGLGLGTGANAASQLTYVIYGTRGLDNTYLQVLVEQGFPGLALLLLALIALLLGLARRGILTTDAARAGPAVAAAGVLVSHLVLQYTLLSLTGLPAMLLWAIVGLGLAPFVSARASGQTRAWLPGAE